MYTKVLIKDNLNLACYNAYGTTDSDVHSGLGHNLVMTNDVKVSAPYNAAKMKYQN